jgi:hypothetical protein
MVEATVHNEPAAAANPVRASAATNKWRLRKLFQEEKFNPDFAIQN